MRSVALSSTTVTPEAIDVEPADAVLSDVALDALAALLVDDWFREQGAEQ